MHLDVVRGVAILLVLGQHAPVVVRIHPSADIVSDHLHKYGYLGVDLFFVLSGFLIGGLLFAELARTGSLNVGRFLTRRAFKIWPAYLICLTACCVLTGVLGRDMYGAPTTLGAVFADMWPAYLHVQNYLPSSGRFVWFWSLGVEEHFYLTLPIALLLFTLRPTGVAGRRVALRRVMLLGGVVGVACLMLRGMTLFFDSRIGGYTHYFPTHLRIDSLMAGVLLAAVAQYAPERLTPLRPWRWLFGLFATGLFVLPAILPGQTYSSIYPLDCTLVSIGAAGVVMLAYFADVSSGATRPASSQSKGFGWWPTRAVAFVGFYSYSIYLWHGYFGPAITRRVMDAADLPIGGTGPVTVVHLATYVAIAVGLGVASYWTIERPLLILRDRLFPRRERAGLPQMPKAGP